MAWDRAKQIAHGVVAFEGLAAEIVRAGEAQRLADGQG